MSDEISQKKKPLKTLLWMPVIRVLSSDLNKWSALQERLSGAFSVAQYLALAERKTREKPHSRSESRSCNLQVLRGKALGYRWWGGVLVVKCTGRGFARQASASEFLQVLVRTRIIGLLDLTSELVRLGGGTRFSHIPGRSEIH